MMAGESNVPSPVGPSPSRAVVASGWLGADSMYEQPYRRKLGGAMATSLLVHGGLVALLVMALAVVPQQVLDQAEHLEFKAIFMPEPGRGGGGGGSPAPAPKKQLEVPKHEAPSVAPVPVVQPVEPPPALLAPIQTNTASILQATGNSAVSLAALGGGGSGGGLGSGRGSGVGEGYGGGFGGGAYAPGNGVSWPVKVLEVRPKYTPDGMRARIQGEVELEIVVLETGRVGSVRVTKSLDRASGLDDAAMDAAKQWVFKPGMKDGKPVPTKVTMVLEFRLH